MNECVAAIQLLCYKMLELCYRKITRNKYYWHIGVNCSDIIIVFVLFCFFQKLFIVQY